MISLPLDKALTMDEGLPFVQILIHKTHREFSKDRIIKVLSINKFSTTQMDQSFVKYVDEEDTLQIGVGTARIVRTKQKHNDIR